MRPSCWTTVVALASGLLLAFPGQATRAGAPEPTRVETLLVLEPGKEFPRHSEGDILLLKDGTWCLVYSRFRGGDSDHAAADLVMRTSSDQGNTWTDDEIVVKQRGGRNVMSVSLLRLQSGAIALFYLRKESLDDCRPQMRLSHDEAKTWSEPIECITDQVGYYVMNNDRAVQLASGRIVLPVALHRTQGAAQADWFGEVMCYLSDDGGKTWRRSRGSRKAFRSGGDREIVQEPGVVALANGSLLMFCRTDGGSQYFATSADEGENWSKLRPSRLASPRSPATIERIPATGHLLCVWNDHSGEHVFQKGKRTPLCAAVSRDQGQTWSRSRVIESDPGGWYCYTSMTFSGDQVVLSYCAGDELVGGLNRLKVVALSLQDLASLAAEGRETLRDPPFLDSAIDYGRSFINTKAVWNSPRFWVESRCRLTDPASGTTQEFFQCGSCKSEDTFAERNLFTEPNYDFLPIFSAEHTVVFRHGLSAAADPREVRPTDQWWDGITPRIRSVRARVLATPEEIFTAIEAGDPIVGQTELHDQRTGRVAVLEYPIKTINWHREKMLWQVDTGPVLLPDLSQPPDRWPHTVQLAYVAFNRDRGADFVVMQPTAINTERQDDGQKESRVHHYGRPVHRETRNVLLAIPGDNPDRRPVPK